MTTTNSFAELLVRLRKEAGLSRSQLSEGSGLSYPYVSQLETGIRKPSRKAAFELARALGLDAQVLEGSIPGDDDDDSELQRARSYTDQVLSGASAPPLLALTSRLRAPTKRADASEPDREDLLGDMLDLLEEFGIEERLEVLAEVQKRAMQRMLDERDRRSP